MFSNLYYSFLYEPLYNALVFLAGLTPQHSLGVAIVVLTIVIRLIILPIYHRASLMQKKIKALDPSLREIKEKHQNDRQAQTLATLELYRRHGINPLSSFFGLLIQLPLLLALYHVFRTGFEPHLDRLYGFISYPETLDTIFLGFVDLAGRSWPIAILVGLTQFVQMRLALPPQPPQSPTTPSGKGDFQAELGRTLNWQMRYIMPVVIIFVAGSLPAAVGLYWIISNLFAAGHEFLVRRSAKGLIASPPTTN